jgi:hypothetical protein
MYLRKFCGRKLSNSLASEMTRCRTTLYLRYTEAPEKKRKTMLVELPLHGRICICKKICNSKRQSKQYKRWPSHTRQEVKYLVDTIPIHLHGATTDGGQGSEIRTALSSCCCWPGTIYLFSGIQSAIHKGHIEYAPHRALREQYRVQPLTVTEDWCAPVLTQWRWRILSDYHSTLDRDETARASCFLSKKYSQTRFLQDD